MINSTGSQQQATCFHICSFCLGSYFIAYMISVKLFNNLVRKTGFTNLFSQGETEAAGQLRSLTSDRAEGTRGRPRLDRVRVNIP